MKKQLALANPKRSEGSLPVSKLAWISSDPILSKNF